MNKNELNYRSIYDYIVSLDECIRFVGIIDEMGRLVYGGMRQGKKSLENETDSIKLYVEFALISKLHNEFDSSLGQVIYSLTEREKIKTLSFPFKEHIIRLSLEREADHEQIKRSILNFLSSLL